MKALVIFALITYNSFIAQGLCDDVEDIYLLVRCYYANESARSTDRSFLRTDYGNGNLTTVLLSQRMNGSAIVVINDVDGDEMEGGNVRWRRCDGRVDDSRDACESRLARCEEKLVDERRDARRQSQNFSDADWREEAEGAVRSTYRERANPPYPNASQPSFPSQSNESIPGDDGDEATVTASADNTITEMDAKESDEITVTDHPIVEPTTFRFPHQIVDNPRNCLFGLESLERLSARLTDEEWQYLLDIGVERITAPTSRGMCLYHIEPETAICSPKITTVQSSYLCRM
jgi:hypothetical protein